MREGEKPLPESTIDHYLHNSKAFICETKKESFRRIDPKTGYQETNGSGEKMRTSTTALVFYYDMLGISIDMQVSKPEDEDEPGMIPSDPEYETDMNPPVPPF